jgi:alpha-L-glutamate ligase-like protein
MVKASDILGLNARSQLYSYRVNDPKAKKTANSKLATKRVLKAAGIPVPEIYAKFLRPQNILKFKWNKLPESFALKPNKGLGGEGIIVVKKRSRDGKGWITTARRKVLVDDLQLHVMDILEGAYSIGNVPDTAYLEEFVGRHKAFKRYAFRGTPDIRIIIFNKVPVMAMLRLPTKESGGRANLHQGAIAVGIDIATGITTKAYWHGRFIRYKPDSKRKLHGIKIPNWTKVLEIAVGCQIITGIGYLGADIVLHPDKGPMVLELNYQPGLSIQLANQAGLRRRLVRVDDLNVKDAEHGVKIAKALFASHFADRVKAEEGIKILKTVEDVKVYGKTKSVKVKARVDTGAVRTSIDEELANSLGLLEEGNILWRKRYAYRSAAGRQSRPVIGLTLRLGGKKFSTTASVANRKKMTTPLLIGRNDMRGFLVRPEEE